MGGVVEMKGRTELSFVQSLMIWLLIFHVPYFPMISSALGEMNYHSPPYPFGLESAVFASYAAVYGDAYYHVHHRNALLVVAVALLSECLQDPTRYVTVP